MSRKMAMAAGAIALAALANDRGDDHNEPGVIYLANEARFTRSSFSEALTNYTVGWRDEENILETLEFLFPSVEVSRRFEFKKADNAQAFLSELDDQRAINGDFKFVEYGGESVDSKTINKGLSIKVDFDEEPADGDWREKYTNVLMERLFRSELRRCVTTALAAATNTAKTWNGTAGEDPDLDVLKRIRAGRLASGVRPTRVLYGDGAWTARVHSTRSQDTPGGHASSALSVQQVGGFLGAETRVSNELYQSGADAKTEVMGNLILAFYARKVITKDDPSHTKRFVSKCRGGGRTAVYVREHDKYGIITVEHYSRGVVTTDKGLQKLTITPAA